MDMKVFINILILSILGLFVSSFWSKYNIRALQDRMAVVEKAVGVK